MYVPPEFQQTDKNELIQFVQRFPLAMLITQSTELEPHITHIPFLAVAQDDEIHFEAHIATANPHSQHLKNGKVSTLVFQGHSAYVSSSVYTHQNVPTYNYQVVHVHGTIEPFNASELKTHLEKSIHHFEHTREKPLKYNDFNQQMLDSYEQQILGFRFIPYKWEGAYKLSQNRKTEDFERIITDLEKNPNAHGIAHEMKRIGNKK
jgi:transcriptional regulator